MLCRASSRACSMCAGVQRQRPAASLRLGRFHPAPFRGQHAHGGLVHVREREPLHAPGQERHPAALGARGRRRGRDALPHARQRHRRRQFDHRGQSPPQAVWRAGGEPPREAASQPAGDRQRRQGPAHARGVRHQRHQQRAEGGVARGPRVALLDARARALDERPVLHARRARRHARHAAEAVVHVRDERRRQLGPPFHARLHQVDAAAGRVHLLAPQQIRRAGRKAEPAVDARVDARDRRAIGPRKRPIQATGLFGGGRVRHTGPRPPPRMPAGSSARFSAASRLRPRHRRAPHVHGVLQRGRRAQQHHMAEGARSPKAPDRRRLGGHVAIEAEEPRAHGCAAHEDEPRQIRRTRLDQRHHLRKRRRRPGTPNRGPALPRQRQLVAPGLGPARRR